MWSYAAVILGAVVLSLGLGRRLWKRKSAQSSSIDVGRLGDAWLAEQRAKRNDRLS